MFILQSLHPFVVSGSFFLLVAIFYHRKFVLHARQDDVQEVFLPPDRFEVEKSNGSRAHLVLKCLALLESLNLLLQCSVTVFQRSKPFIVTSNPLRSMRSVTKAKDKSTVCRSFNS